MTRLTWVIRVTRMTWVTRMTRITRVTWVTRMTRVTRVKPCGQKKVAVVERCGRYGEVGG